MAENLFTSLKISSQGLGVQRQRLSAVAKNIANANTTRGENGDVYKREVVIAKANPKAPFFKELENQIAVVGTNGTHAPNLRENVFDKDTKAVTTQVVNDNSPPRKIYDPSHPDANEEGYVEMPNVNIVTEMVEMISAQRSFEANTSVISSAKNMARESLEI